MPLSSALRFLSVWSGSMAFAESRPVDVCLETIYGLDSGVILSTLLHLPYPDRGVVWHSVQSAFTRLFTCLLLVFLLPRICAFVCSIVSPSPTDELSFPPCGNAKRVTGAPWVVYMFIHKVQPGPVLNYIFYCLSARDTVLPYSL